MKVGRNDPCPCGSGEKYKKCCEAKDEKARTAQLEADQAKLPDSLEPEEAARLKKKGETAKGREGFVSPSKQAGSGGGRPSHARKRTV